MNRSIVTATACILALATAPAWPAGNPAAGKQKAEVCKTCHGADGNSSDSQFPRLAGQYPDYLVRALLDYKSGARRSAVMSGFVTDLSPRDMEDLAAYYAGQKAELFVRH